jgi:exopolyphosphatase/guanosine-5'-triphosphate,3'-diphosphate pyrophosphatase
VREAADGQAFCDTVAAETGLQIRVLSGEEEARYAALGVLAGIPDAEWRRGDLGGSSLELIRLGGGKVERGITLPLGPFALADPRGLRRRPPAHRDRQAAEARRRLRNRHPLRRRRRLADPGPGAHGHQRLSAARSCTSTDERRRGAETARLIARQSKASLEKWPGLSKKRAETLPHAALVLEGLIDRLGLKTIVLSRPGACAKACCTRRWTPTAADDPLLAGSSALGARQGISPTLPGALRGWIEPCSPPCLPSFERGRDAVLADAACRLADLGARLHPGPPGRAGLRSGAARAGAGPDPCRAGLPGLRRQRPLRRPLGDARARHRLAPADEEQRLGARALGLAIRLACDLSGRSPQLLVNARPTVKDGALLLTASAGYADVLLGEQTRRRGKALAEAMG